MSFFNQFPKIKYDLRGNSLLTNVTDIFRNVDVNDILADTNNSYLFYDIPDGDRPDIVSRRLYDDPRYYWTFFIINDHLKNGVLDSWPKSSGELERFLEDQYDAYSVIELFPEFRSSEALALVSKGITISVNGIDLSYENLRVSVKSLIEAEDQGGSSAPRWKILKYDSNRYQLWIDAPDSITHFNRLKAENDYLVLTLVNEVVGTTARDAVTAKNNAWLGVNSASVELGTGFLLYVKTAIATLKGTDNASADLIRSAAVYKSVKDFAIETSPDNKYKCMHLVKFKASDTWFVGRDAPIAFKDSAGNNVTTYRKRANTSIGVTTEISYADYEIAANDDKRKIRVLPVRLIRQFSEEYEKKLNE